jgi:hypothetical protein
LNPRSCTVNDHPSRQCACRQFNFDPYGDHIQTCQCQSHRVEPIKSIRTSVKTKSFSEYPIHEYSQMHVLDSDGVQQGRRPPQMTKRPLVLSPPPLTP